MKWRFQITTVLIFLFLSLNSYAGVSAINFDPLRIVTNGNMIATITSSVVPLDNVQDFSIEGIWTGSPNGSIIVQVSNDMVNSSAAIAANSWVDYTNTSQTITTAGNFLWNFTNQNMKWLRVVYTFSSGTGTLNVIYGRKI